MLGLLTLIGVGYDSTEGPVQTGKRNADPTKSRDEIVAIFGNCDMRLDQLISRCLEQAVKDHGLSLRATTLEDSEDLIRMTATRPFDLLVLVLNNIRLGSEPGQSDEEHIATMLDLLGYLKATHRKPIVALAGWPQRDRTFPKRVKLAGADVFFPLPFSAQGFIAAVKNILGVTR
jgi:hypothetical protein